MPNKLKKKITLIGSTGLIGSHFLENIRSDDCQIVNAVTRHKISNLENKKFIKQSVHNFLDLEEMRKDLKTDVLVSTLGTTIKKAGSKDEFMKIDHDIPIEIGRIAKEEGCKTMILISSIGASTKSKVFYSYVKGKIEESLEDIGFEEFHILRPSLLLGNRMETRPAEYISKLFLDPLSFLIPWEYRPIDARTIAKNIIYLIRGNIFGKHIWQGKNLFEIKNSCYKQNLSFR